MSNGNIFLNSSFEDGFAGWSTDRLARVVTTGTRFAPLPAAKLPGSASISQYCDDAQLFSSHLRFGLDPMSSDRLGLQLRVDYTDGHQTAAFVGFGVGPFAVYPEDEDHRYRADEVLVLTVAVDQERLLRSFTLTNMNDQANGAIAVTGFYLVGQRADADGDGETPARGVPKARAGTRETWRTRMYALERKLDILIARTEARDKPKKSY